MRVEFNGLRFNLPQGWSDITNDLPTGAPLSLARSTGVGAVQFSVAKYRGGKEPAVTINNLRELLADFCSRNGMRYDKTVDHFGKIESVGATSITNGELTFATYLSNGKDVVLVTYTCKDSDNQEIQKDLSGAEVIVNSMEF